MLWEAEGGAPPPVLSGGMVREAFMGRRWHWSKGVGLGRHSWPGVQNVTRLGGMKQPMGWAGVMGESEHGPVINRLGCQAKERRFSPEVPGDSERTVGRGGMGADL